MINLYYETDFKLDKEELYKKWIRSVIHQELKKEGDINFIFCDDDYLLKINQDYLNHDTLTDIISFDYSVGNELHGDVFISKERVSDNATSFDVSFSHEMARVMVHGILHYCGYKDKTKQEKQLMREKENMYLKTFMEIL